MTAHMLSDCGWEPIEKGKAKGSSYSILQCSVCGRDTAVVQGDRVHPAQFSCPFEITGAPSRS